MTVTVSALKSAAQAGSYYEEHDDYYSEGKTARSSWHGSLANELGLDGPVNSEEFTSMLSGNLPNGEHVGRWSKNEKTGEKEWQHRPGYDLTFSASKSVTMAALVGGDSRVQDAHDDAVSTVLDAYEQYGSARHHVRTKDDDKTFYETTGKLAFAKFRHETNRNQDATLHTHAVAMNLTQTADGKYRAIESRPFFRLQREISFAYEAELGANLHDLGYDVERVNDNKGHAHVEIKGHRAEDYQALIKRHSTRRAEINAYLEARDIDPKKATGAQREKAALNTRKTKSAVDHDKLRSEWRETAEANNEVTTLDTLVERAVINEGRSDVDAARDAEKAVSQAAVIISERDARFTLNDLRGIAYRESIGGRAHIGDIDTAIDTLRERGELIERDVETRDVRNGKAIIAQGFTTEKAIAIEEEMLSIEASGRGRVAPLADAGTAKSIRLAAEKQSEYGFNRGQCDAIDGILGTSNSVVALQGYAGTAKTTTVLKTVSEEAQKQGITVRAVAPTASAAEQLRDGAEIENATTLKSLTVQQRGADPDAKKNAELWICDETSLASAVDTRDLLRCAQSSGARLVLVGDTAQLGSVGAGQAFEQLQNNGMETLVLDKVLRQRNDELRAGVESLIERDAAAAMENIRSSGKIIEVRSETGTGDDRRDAGHEEKTENKAEKNVPGAARHERRQKLAKQYLCLSQQKREKTLLLDPTRAGRKEINTSVRQGLKSEGVIGATGIEPTLRTDKFLTSAELKSTASYTPGDIVEFNRNYKRDDVTKEGDYIVTDVDAEAQKVTLCDRSTGEERTFRPETKRAGGVSVYEEEQEEIAVGESIRFTKNNKAAGWVNGDAASVVSVDGENNSVSVQLDRTGKTIDVDVGSVAGQHIEHNYCSTVFASQGSTQDHVLAHVESDQEDLVNMKSFYVAVSRAKESVTLITDNKEELEKAILDRAGDAPQALLDERETENRIRDAEPEAEQSKEPEQLEYEDDDYGR